VSGNKWGLECDGSYLNGPEARSVTGGHVLVKRIDGGDAGHLTVLLVHVVGTGARVVPDPDTEVLDLLGLLLVDLEHVSLALYITIVYLHAPGLRRRSLRWPS
jgi:hypothetical protein